MVTEDFAKRKLIIYPAVIGLLLFGFFELIKPVYFRAQQKTLTANLQIQISALLSPAADNNKNLANILMAEDTLLKLTKNSGRLSLNTLAFEQNYILLESLDQHYSYREKLSGLLTKIFEYDAENDLNGRSISENKGDFMYRLSLTQYALKTVTTKLKEYDREPDLADYTKKITNQFPPIIDLIDQLIKETSKDQTKTSNQLRLQYITDIRKLQTTLRPLYNQTLLDLDSTILSLLSQIKI